MAELGSDRSSWSIIDKLVLECVIDKLYGSLDKARDEPDHKSRVTEAFIKIHFQFPEHYNIQRFNNKELFSESNIGNSRKIIDNNIRSLALLKGDGNYDQYNWMKRRIQAIIDKNGIITVEQLKSITEDGVKKMSKFVTDLRKELL